MAAHEVYFNSQMEKGAFLVGQSIDFWGSMKQVLDFYEIAFGYNIIDRTEMEAVRVFIDNQP